MSTWVHVTNLPMYSDHPLLLEIFHGIGLIQNISIVKNEFIMKSQAFVQFSKPQHAKTACSKKDETIVEKSQIRVFLIWSPEENLSTIRVSNYPEEYRTEDLYQLFNTHGDIVDIRIESNGNHLNDQKSDSTPSALISFVRVEHATSAAQEMDGSVIGCEGALSVNLVNSDARNLQWKRHSFEYISIAIPEVSDDSFSMQKQRRHRRRGHKHGDSYRDTKSSDRLHPPHRNHHGRQRHQRHDRRHEMDPHHPPSPHHRKHHKRRSVREKASQSTLLGPLYNGSNGQYHTYSVTPSPTSSRNLIQDPPSMDVGHGHYSSSLQYSTSLQRTSSSDSAEMLLASFVPPHSGPNRRTAMDHYGMPSKYQQTHHSPQPYMIHPPQQMHTPVSPATSIISTASTTHSVPTPTGYLPQIPRPQSLTPTGVCLPQHTPTSTTPVSTQHTPPLTGLRFPVNPIFAPHSAITGTNPMLNGMHGITTGMAAVSVDSVKVPSPTALAVPFQPQQPMMGQMSQCSGNMVQHQPMLYSPPTLQGPLEMTPTSQPRDFQFPVQPQKASKTSSTKKRKKNTWTKEQQQIGNVLIQIVNEKYPQRATKIVGMFLSAFNVENLRFLIQKKEMVLGIALGYDQQVRDKEARKSQANRK